MERLNSYDSPQGLYYPDDAHIRGISNAALAMATFQQKPRLWSKNMFKVALLCCCLTQNDGRLRRSSYTGPLRWPRSTRASTGMTGRSWAPSTATDNTGSTLALIQKPARRRRGSSTPSTPSGTSWGRSAPGHSPISGVWTLSVFGLASKRS